MNNNFDSKKINALLSSLNGKIDKNTVSKAIENGNAENLVNNLSSQDKEKIHAILNDKNILEEILKSPKAAAIMKMLEGKSKNG